MEMVINVKCSHTVKPSQPTPNTRLSLPECDQVMGWTHLPTVYFYQPFLCESPFESLKSSLGRVLVHYYPFAGRLNWISGGRFVLDCNEMGVEITEAESDARIEDYGDFRPSADMGKLVPCVDYTKNISELPLMLIQVTRFKCGGMCLGVANSHVITGGFGASQFFCSWAKIARGEKLDVLPFHDRSVVYNGDPLVKPLYDHVELQVPPTLISDEYDEKEERVKETSVNMLKLTKKQIQKLKDRANEGKPKDGSRDYSRFEAIAGHIWRCTSMARKHKHEQLTVLSVSVDFRNHLQPPLPLGYYGNTITRTTPMAKSGDLVSLGLSYAASKIRESVGMATKDDYIKSYMDLLRSQPDISPFRSEFNRVGDTQGVYYGNPNLAITSWFGFDIYNVDFGWSRPIFVGPPVMNDDDGNFIIMPRDDGSVMIPVGLQVAHMDDLEKFFYQEINLDNHCRL